MRVVFKSFGPLKRVLGNSQIELEVPENSTVRTVVEMAIEAGGESLRELIMQDERISGNLIILLNKRDVSTLQGVETQVNEDDEIAILPHVQGG
ncbi:MAG: MoaD/ThiS family protein [Candidatus Hodarchaeota archaeon]